MSKRVDEQFWSRAHLSREVFDIVKALDAAGQKPLSTPDRQVLSEAVELINAILEGRRTIGQPEVSPRWALNALRFRSAANALAKLKHERQGLDHASLEYLDQLKASLTKVVTTGSTEEVDLSAAREFFRAFREILMSTFGSPHERTPIRYL